MSNGASRTGWRMPCFKGFSCHPEQERLLNKLLLLYVGALGGRHGTERRQKLSPVCRALKGERSDHQKTDWTLPSLELLLKGRRRPRGDQPTHPKSPAVDVNLGADVLVVRELWGHRRDDVVVVDPPEAFLRETGAVVHPGVKGRGPSPIENPDARLFETGGRGGVTVSTVQAATQRDASFVGLGPCTAPVLSSSSSPHNGMVSYGVTVVITYGRTPHCCA